MLDKLPLDCLLAVLNQIPQPKYNSQFIPRRYGSTNQTMIYFKKNSTCNYVIPHLMKLAMVCKSFHKIFRSDELWLPMIIRDFRKGVPYKRIPKNMQFKYIQKFIYPKALEEFSITIEKLERNRCRYIYERLYQIHIRRCVMRSIVNDEERVTLNLQYGFSRINSQSKLLIFICEKTLSVDPFWLSRTHALYKKSIRKFKNNTLIKNGFTVDKLPCVKVLLGVMNSLHKKTSYIEKEIDRINRLYQETNLDNFKVVPGVHFNNIAYTVYEFV